MDDLEDFAETGSLALILRLFVPVIVIAFLRSFALLFDHIPFIMHLCDSVTIIYGSSGGDSRFEGDSRFDIYISCARHV